VTVAAEGAFGAEILLPQRRVFVLSGVDEITALDRQLDDVAARCGSPVTARWPWIAGTLDDSGDCAAVLVEDDDGGLAAAAVLVTAADGVVRFASGGDGHRAAVPAADDDAAVRLSEGVWQEIAARSSDGFELGPMPADSISTQVLLDSASESVKVRESQVPVIRRRTLATASHYLTRNMRRTIRRGRNHVTVDGLEAVVRRSTDPDRIERALPHLADLGRERDRVAGRFGIFDDPAAAGRWQRRTIGLARLGLAEMSALLINEAPAAVNVAFVDPPYYRVLEGRIDARFARYAPGRLLEADLLEGMHDDPRLTALDWMTSLAPEQLLAFNDYEPTVTISGA